jgi:hypothetical protein
MPHKLLADYLKFVEQAILNCKTAYVERYIEDILTPERVNLRIRIRFQQGHLLEINEAVEVVKNKLTSLDYRYHCQNEQNQLIFRYDNTPHFPDLSSFPHHLHLPNDVISCEKPSIEQVVTEAVLAGENPQ